MEISIQNQAVTRVKVACGGHNYGVAITGESPANPQEIASAIILITFNTDYLVLEDSSYLEIKAIDLPDETFNALYEAANGS